MNDIYLSCRRSFSASIALALTHALRAQCCEVFLDLNPFDDRDALDLGQIEAHTHFLVILTPALIESLQNPEDLMRLEIEHALSTRRNIVPLLTNGFTFTTTMLPARLSFLRRYYALAVAPETLTENVAVLHERLTQAHFFGQLVPTPPDQRQAVAARMVAAYNQPLPGAEQLRAEVTFNHALARARQDHAGKLKDLDHVLGLNPEHVYARFERAQERRRSGDENGAFDDYNAIVQREPQFYRAYNNRAELYFIRGQYDRALADYEQAMTIRPGYTMALAGKAITAYAQGRVEAALDLWKSLLEQDERFYDVAWVGREQRLPTAIIDEMQRLNLRLRTASLSHAADD